MARSTPTAKIEVNSTKTGKNWVNKNRFELTKMRKMLGENGESNAC